MRTRSETSKKNEYYISKARKYELIWFCKQYKECTSIGNDLKRRSVIFSWAFFFLFEETEKRR